MYQRAALSSSSGDFSVSTDQCIASDHPWSSTDYDLSPGENQALWFLVRGAGSTYDVGGGSQVGPRDPGIDASPQGCP